MHDSADGNGRADEVPRGSMSLYRREIRRFPLLQPEEEHNLARQMSDARMELYRALVDAAPKQTFSIVRRLSQDDALRDKSDYYLGLIPSGAVRQRRFCNDDNLDEMATYLQSHLPWKLREQLVCQVLPELPEEKSAMLRQYHQQYLQLRRRFAAGNYRLVLKMSRCYTSLPLADLVQEGNLGLLEAVERFDYRRRLRFSTYARWWIRHALLQAIEDQSSVVRIASHRNVTFRQMGETQKSLTLALGREPSPEELSNAMGISAEKIEMLSGLRDRKFLSLDRILDEGIAGGMAGKNGASRENLQESLYEMPPEFRMDNERRYGKLRDAFGHLSAIEQDILRRRYGLAAAEEQTLKEVGDSYELSRERIRQLQEGAEKKLKKVLQRAGLR